MSVVHYLYDSEINVVIVIQTFWDCGYQVRIGDELNGFEAHADLKRWEGCRALVGEDSDRALPGEHVREEV